jgi:hypothetical protein
MITFNIIERVIWIKFGNTCGTAFTFDIGNRRFIVTAKHIVKNISNLDKISIFRNNTWNPIDVELIENAKEPIDISVLSPKEKITVDHSIIETEEYYYGEDIFFLGFPLGVYSDFTMIGLDLPVPLIKKGIISIVQKKEGAITVLIDGHNNPGFSGAPVVKMNNGIVELISVISGYKINEQKLFMEKAETDYYVKENTGIIVSYGFVHAREIMIRNIKKGFQLL